MSNMQSTSPKEAQQVENIIMAIIKASRLDRGTPRSLEEVDAVAEALHHILHRPPNSIKMKDKYKSIFRADQF